MHHNRIKSIIMLIGLLSSLCWSAASYAAASPALFQGGFQHGDDPHTYPEQLIVTYTKTAAQQPFVAFVPVEPGAIYKVVAYRNSGIRSNFGYRIKSAAEVASYNNEGNCGASDTRLVGSGYQGLGFFGVSPHGNDQEPVVAPEMAMGYVCLRIDGGRTQDGDIGTISLYKVWAPTQLSGEPHPQEVDLGYSQWGGHYSTISVTTTGPVTITTDILWRYHYNELETNPGIAGDPIQDTLPGTSDTWGTVCVQVFKSDWSLQRNCNGLSNQGE